MKHIVAPILGLSLLVSAMPAKADEPLELKLGGFGRFYVGGVMQNERNGDVSPIRLRRDTEIHFDAKKEFHPDLTVAVHIEADMYKELDFPDESNVSFSGRWGKFIYGDEDAASYLLQVAIPSADNLVDGLSQYINPVDYVAAGIPGNAAGEEFDYDQTLTSDLDKLTYITPQFNGFQAGFSYTPDTKDAAGGFYSPSRRANRLSGPSFDNVDGAFGEVYDGGIRYEGELATDTKLTLGTGITNIKLEGPAAGLDDFVEWNAGINLQYKAYAIGYAHQRNNGGVQAGGDEKVNVVGLSYRVDPKLLLGTSVYQQNDKSFANTGVEVDTLRYSIGATYDYVPGLSFRASVARIEHDVDGGKDVNANYALLGTAISF